MFSNKKSQRSSTKKEMIGSNKKRPDFEAAPKFGELDTGNRSKERGPKTITTAESEINQGNMVISLEINEKP